MPTKKTTEKAKTDEEKKITTKSATKAGAKSPAKKKVVKKVAEKKTKEKTSVEKKEKEVEKKASSAEKDRYYEGIGRRKSSTARVRLYTKKKSVIVNGKSYKEYFPLIRLQKSMEAPFETMKVSDKFGLSAKVSGGGIKAQSEAIALGIGRALVKFNQDFKKRLRRGGFLTRDARKVERKKYGLKKARKAPQWSKR